MWTTTTTHSNKNTLSRKYKWQTPPPPPSPKILHLPRRLKLIHHSTKKPQSQPNKTRNLRSLLTEEKSNVSSNALEVDRWKAEAEMLRVQCENIKMERDAALLKLEKSKERKKIDGDSIEKKMGKLKLRSKEAADELMMDNVKEIREVHEVNVDILKRKMDVISKGMMERKEEYGSFLISANNNDDHNSSMIKGIMGRRNKATNQRQTKELEGSRKKCCFNCKDIVRRVADEVEAESKQWTEMQDMLDQVRLEMDQLKSSRDLWHQRAIASDMNLRSLFPHMVEWKKRAQAYEQKITDLRKHIFHLEKSSWDEAITPIITTSTSLNCRNMNKVKLQKFKCQQLRQEKENEKKVLVCRTNNTKSNILMRLPLRDIGNF